jgi:hypothetical protein
MTAREMMRRERWRAGAAAGELARQDSNLGIAESKSADFPPLLGKPQ